jgi:hypothetical protein
MARGLLNARVNGLDVTRRLLGSIGISSLHRVIPRRAQNLMIPPVTEKPQSRQQFIPCDPDCLPRCREASAQAPTIYSGPCQQQLIPGSNDWPESFQDD